jgi:RNA polymerase sigma-70 factor (ECF subfamily)
VVIRIVDMRFTSETSLIDGVRAGSHEAWTELFRRHAQPAWRTAHAIVRDHARAEDVVQDAFLAAIRSEQRFDRRLPFRPWLLRTVTNRAIDVLRHERRATPGYDADALASTTDRGVDDGLREAVGCLDPDRRTIVVLRYWLDLTPSEIAERLGIPVGTVASRLHRALEELSRHAEVTPRV